MYKCIFHKGTTRLSRVIFIRHSCSRFNPLLPRQLNFMNAVERNRCITVTIQIGTSTFYYWPNTRHCIVVQRGYTYTRWLIKNQNFFISIHLYNRVIRRVLTQLNLPDCLLKLFLLFGFYYRVKYYIKTNRLEMFTRNEYIFMSSLYVQ